MKLENFFFKHNKASLAIISAVALLIVYVSAGNTVRTLWQYFELNQEMGNVKTEMPAMVNVDLDDWMQVDINKSAFEAVSSASARYNVLIEKMDPAQAVVEGECEVFTKRITLQGKYVDILQCLSSMASDLKHIKIVSINFGREQRGKLSVLLAEVYFQTVKPVRK